MKMQSKLKLAAAPVAIGVALVAQPVMAQDSTVDGRDDVAATSAPDQGTIVVTGSRIQRTDVDAPSPIQLFDEELIEARGSANIQDFLFESNIAGPGLFNENSTLSQFAGSAFFDSRGFGSGYTLILLNGRRLPGAPIGGVSATDVNLVPIAAVDRIEYLSDGASAIYGSDAISGVINIITKRDFEGLSLNGRAGIADNGDGFQYRVSGVWGAASDRASATVTAEYFHQDTVDAANRPYIESANGPEELGGTDGRSPTGFPGSWVRVDPVTFNFIDAVPFEGCPAESIRPTSFASQGTECAYDFAPLYQVFPEVDRFITSAFAEYDVTDTTTVYLDGRYSRTETKVRNGAAPANFFVPAGQQGNPFPEAAFALRRIVDGGPRSRNATNQSYSVAVGFEQEINENHQAFGYLQQSWYDQNQLGISGNISVSALTEAVQNGTFRLDRLNSQEVVDAISVTTFRLGQLKETIVNAGVSGLVPLGGFDIGYALGVESRNESYVDKTDIAQQSGDIAGGAASDGEGDRSVRAAYAELGFSPFDMLEISLAGRYDDVRAAGSKLGDEFTYKAAASFTPIEPITLRGSYSTGFKAPQLGELFLGRSFGVTRAVDTTVCNRVTGTPGATQAEIDSACRTREIRSVSGGNPNLEPETSESYNFGAVVRPTPDMRISADYWNIKVDGKIGALGVQEILNNEAQYPALVNRVGGQLSSPDAFVASNLQNLTREQGEGIDFVFNWTPQLTDSIEAVLDLRASYLISFERQSSAIQPLCEDAGTTSEPEWRGNGRLGLIFGQTTTNVTARYVGETTDLVGGRNGVNDAGLDPCGITPNGRLQDVRDYLEFGANVQFDVTENLRATFGVQNVFDELPAVSEIAAGGWPWYDQALYSNMGRYFYAEIGLDF